MYVRFLGITGAIVAIAAISGCGRRDSIGGLKAPEKLILYSLDGRDDRPDTSEKAADEREMFHGFPVLGKVDIQDAAKRREILEAVDEGMAVKGVNMRDCFWPRHGIEAEENGRTVAYVICFECRQLQVYRDGATKTVATDRKPQSVLNKHLKDAGIPLASGMVDDE